MSPPRSPLTLAEILGLNRRRRLTAPVRAIADRMKAAGQRLTAGAGALLVKLDDDGGEAGVTPLTGVYPRALLATLKSLGLVDTGEPDRLGDRRYRVSDDGRLVARVLRGRK